MPEKKGWYKDRGEISELEFDLWTKIHDLELEPVYAKNEHGIARVVGHRRVLKDKHTGEIVGAMYECK